MNLSSKSVRVSGGPGTHQSNFMSEWRNVKTLDGVFQRETHINPEFGFAADRDKCCSAAGAGSNPASLTNHGHVQIDATAIFKTQRNDSAVGLSTAREILNRPSKFNLAASRKARHNQNLIALS